MKQHAKEQVTSSGVWPGGEWDVFTWNWSSVARNCVLYLREETKFHKHYMNYFIHNVNGSGHLTSTKIAGNIDFRYTLTLTRHSINYEARRHTKNLYCSKILSITPWIFYFTKMLETASYFHEWWVQDVENRVPYTRQARMPVCFNAISQRRLLRNKGRKMCTARPWQLSIAYIHMLPQQADWKLAVFLSFGA
jgi:hypothetical protein